MIAQPPIQKPTGRLDPRTMLLDFFKSLGRFGWVLILYFVVSSRGRGDSAELLFAGLAIFGLFGSLIQWLTVRFGVVGPNFVYETIWLLKKEKTIPIDRIQSVNIEQTLIHRMLGLAKVRIDTAASGDKADIELDSLSLAEAERLRMVLTKETVHPSEVATPSLPLWQATSRDLLMAGATKNAWVVIIGAGASLLPFVRGSDSSLLSAVRGSTNSTVPPQVWVIGLLGLLLAGWIVSMAQAWVKFYGFTLTHNGGRLHREYGLINNRKNSVPLRRIQCLDWSTTWLRSWVGFWEVKCFTAGAMKDKQDPTVGGLLCPVVPSAKLRTFTNIVFADLDWSGLRWTPAPARAFWVRFVEILWLYGILGVGLSIWQRHWAIWLLPLCVLISALSAYLEVRSMKVAFSGRFAFTQAGWRNTQLLIVPLDKVQSVELEQGLLQRKLGLATVTLVVAGSPAVHLSHLPVQLASRAAEKAVPWIARTGSWSADGV